MFHKLSSLQQEFILSVLKLGVQTQPQYWWVLQRLWENLLPDSLLVSGNNQQCSTSLDLWWWCSVAKSSPTLCDPMDCSTAGFPILHYLPKLAETDVHLTILSSVVSLSSCPQSFPASGSFGPIP